MLNILYKALQKRKAIFLILASIVVSITTYSLILPAFTLEIEKAKEQGGIELEEQADAVEEETSIDEQAEAPEAAVKDDQPEADLTLEADNKEYGVLLTYDKDAAIPADASLCVNEIKSGKDFDKYMDKAKAAVDELARDKNKQSISSAKFFDITIKDGNKEIEPKSTVDVKFDFDKGMKLGSENGRRNKENVKIIHFTEDKKGAIRSEILDKDDFDVVISQNKLTEATICAESFSVYAIIYTVDFHYDMNGKSYDYTIEGGSVLLLSDLLSGLGAEIGIDTADIDKVTFSDPSLISITKKNNDFELKSLKPFDTEETLTVTLKNGDSFKIRVTDAQEITIDNPEETKVSDLISSDEVYIICTVTNDGKYHLLKTDGTTDTRDSAPEFDKLDSTYRWTFNYVFEEKDREGTLDYIYYLIRPIDKMSNTIALNGIGEALVQNSNNNIAVVPRYEGSVFKGFNFIGYNNTYLGLNGNNFTAQTGNGSYIHVIKMESLSKYDYTVKSADENKGNVTVSDGSQHGGPNNTHYFSAESNSDKRNAGTITAVPVPHTNTDLAWNDPARDYNKWVFDYWELNGVKLEGVGAAISPDTLQIPYNDSELIAHFKQNKDYVVPDNEKEGKQIEKSTLDIWLDKLKNSELPLERKNTNKTAEVYDYENRIYRVDLTSKASLSTFAGTIDLGFIIDVSASMLFPSKLVPITNMNNIHIEDIQSDWNTMGFKTTEQYYLISDETGTSTVIKIFYKNNSWHAVDASKADSASVVIDYNNVHKENASSSPFKNAESDSQSGYRYQIYREGDEDHPGAKRSYYLENSLNGTLSELQTILNKLAIAQNSSSDPEVKIAWNSFCNYVSNKTNARQTTFTSAKDGITLEYDDTSANKDYQGGTSTDIALLDAGGIKRSDVINYTDIFDSTKYGTSTAKVTIDGREYGGTSKYHLWNCKDYESLTYTRESGQGFQWENSATKYAVLITDGAPQRGGKNVHSKYVEEAADELKKGRDGIAGTDDDVTLITIGLSMENVKMGSRLLYDIANDGSDDLPMFYAAKSGDELQYALYEIIKSIMDDATVQGNVYDPINEAFYPVDKSSGKPLENGTMIDLNGNVTTDSSVPHGTIVRTGDSVSGYTYAVNWNGQDISIDGWQGTVYVKAKEDLLGGNAVKTNASDATVDAHSYKIKPTDPPIPLTNVSTKLTSKHIDLPTPRVNINELGFLHDATEWTVYLGTNVDPKDQLKKLFDDILIEEVIKKDKGIDTNSDGLPDTVSYTQGDNDNNWYPLAPDSITDDREPTDHDYVNRNSFLMKDLINHLAEGENYDWWDYETNQPKWDVFITNALNGGMVIPYHEYGLDDGSNITITLTKDIVSGEEEDLVNHSPHATTVVSEIDSEGKQLPVEKYVLTVKYSPDYTVLPKGQGGSSTIDFHNGTFGTMYQGHAAGTETSTNTHIINVFKKGLNITKTDETFNNAIKGAEFTLYRTARDSDPAASKVNIEGLDGKYYALQTLDLADSTNVTIDTIEQLRADEKYYIVETKAPAGYEMLTNPIEVKLELTDVYTPTDEIDDEEYDTHVIADGLNNWEQKARILLNDSHAHRTDQNGNDLSNTGYEADTETAIVYYKISNNSGVELPSAGGPGTHWIYLLGALMVLTSFIALIARYKTGRQ